MNIIKTNKQKTKNFVFVLNVNWKIETFYYWFHFNFPQTIVDLIHFLQTIVSAIHIIYESLSHSNLTDLVRLMSHRHFTFSQYSLWKLTSTYECL